MRATLINPAVAWDGLDGSWIRHGIAGISAYAKSKGHDINLIDLRRMVSAKGIDWESFENKVSRSGTDAFGVSVLSANYDFAKECIERIRKVKPGARIAAGGIHPTVEPEGSKGLGADTYITGEGEENFTRWLEGRPTVADRVNLNELPFADRGLFAPLREQPIGYLPEPFHTIIIGRGCPHLCSFCYPAEKKLFGSKVRMRSVDNVMAELLELNHRYGLNSFLIHDDCFSAFAKYIDEFMEAKAKLIPDALFYCQARADHIVKRPEMFKALYDSGLRGCLIGMESGSQRVLDFLNKKTTVEDNIKAAEILNKIGVQVWANLMVGIPTETKSEVLDTVLMAQKIKAIQPRAILSWASYTPHPGSDLYNYCEERGLSLVEKSADYRRYFEPDNPKIKGVDYNFLSWAVAQCQ
jgi:radical SAM superfamily enzyme YgiQ (UPF0313 family)